MAHTKAKGSSKLGRDSRSKRLGVKVSGGRKVKTGEIIVRQRGSHFYMGENVAKGADDTLYAKKSGQVEFKTKSVKKFTKSLQRKTFVSVKENAS